MGFIADRQRATARSRAIAQLLKVTPAKGIPHQDGRTILVDAIAESITPQELHDLACAVEDASEEDLDENFKYISDYQRAKIFSIGRILLETVLRYAGEVADHTGLTAKLEARADEDESDELAERAREDER